MSKVKRVYVEKKTDYAVKAKELYEELTDYLDLKIESVRVLVRYDVENVSDKTYEKALKTVFSEPPVDYVYETEFPYDEGDKVFSVEALPGQFDQRADSAEQCVKLLNEKEEPIIRCATTYVIKGEIDASQFEAVKAYCSRKRPSGGLSRGSKARRPGRACMRRAGWGEASRRRPRGGGAGIRRRTGSLRDRSSRHPRPSPPPRM